MCAQEMEVEAAGGGDGDGALVTSPYQLSACDLRRRRPSR